MKRFLLPAIAALSLAFAASTTVGAQTTAPPPSTGSGSMSGAGSMSGSGSMSGAGQMSGAMTDNNKMSAMHAPPAILSIETDNIKPYERVPYDKVAAEYTPVAMKAKLPGTVIAMESLSGTPRAQFLFAYDSFQDMQKMEDMIEKNTALTGQFNALDAREGAYVTEVHTVIWHYRDDLSNNAANADVPHCRYWETITFHIKPGHDEQFEGLMKTVQATYLKIGANIPWVTYESEMGASDTYNVFVPMKSLKEEDEGLARDKTFMDALGSEGMHKMDDVARDAYASVEDTLWEVNGKASYVPKEWLTMNPDLWAPKSVAPAAKTTTGMTTTPAMKPAPKPPTQ
ncbi:MAG: hypothetical protein WA871_03220 [Candidatus Acidiferrales bacterium]